MTLCTIIILFHPEKENLENSLESFSKETDCILLYKNSPISADCIRVIEKYKNAELIGNENNVGIAKALNESIIVAESRGYTHVLTMDQDSYFDQGMITCYKEKIQNNTISNVGVFGINPKQDNHTLYPISTEIKEVSDTITSGSVFLVEDFKKYGYFDSSLFIDAVDYDYCYRLKEKYGQKTIVFSDIILNHSVGYIEKTNFGFSINNYSAFRTYFIIRNQFEIWRRYPSQFPKEYKLTLLKDHLIFRIIKILLAEKNKMKKLKAIAVGFFHFLSRKSGFHTIN